MADVVEIPQGTKTYRVSGLEAKAASINDAALEVDTMISERIKAANKAFENWEGKHSATFGADLNPVLSQMATFRLKLGHAARILSALPEPPDASPGLARFVDEIYMSARVEVPTPTGTASGNHNDIKAYSTTSDGQDGRFSELANKINLDGVTATVSHERALTPGERQQELDSGATEAELADKTKTQTDPATSDELAALIPLPSAQPLVAPLKEDSGNASVFAKAVALAFEKSNKPLENLLANNPAAALGVIDVLEDGRADTADGALAILKANWATFDTAGEGGDEDGIVSHKDIRAIMEHPERYSPEVVSAATFLEHNRVFFRLLETTQDNDSPDGKISDEDLQLFMEFNEHLRTLNGNFPEFDTAANGGRPDGAVSESDLEAIAEGTGPNADAAKWLLDHDNQRARLTQYELQMALASGVDTDDLPDVDSDMISRRSLLRLAVDQQIYGAYDLGNLDLPPGTIPPPRPQPYIDRGAAGEFDEDSWYSTLDDEAFEAKMRAAAAGGEATGRVDAARHLRHYLDATGEDLDLDVDRIMRDVPELQGKVDGTVAAELNRIVESGDYGRQVPFSTEWDDYYFHDPNWFAAIGGVQYTVTGTATVHRPASPGERPRVEVQYQVHLYDRYNWDEGDDPATPQQEKGKDATFPVLGTVPDNEMAQLQRAGLAREFDMRGSSNVFEFDGQIPDPSALPDPPDGRSGRDDPNRQAN